MKVKRWISISLAALTLATLAHATALTEARNTPSRAGSAIVVGVYTNTRIFAGSMVAINSSGYAVSASDAASQSVIGAAYETVDNRTNADGAGDSGTMTIQVIRGVFRWVNGDSFTDANIGDLAFVEDDQTVQKAASASNDSIAGVIIDVDDDGVWVDTSTIGSQGSGSLTTLTTSGAVTLGSTLGVTGATTLSGTLAVTGVATFTAESVHNGGVDADYITTDAAAGIDTKTAGTLMVGAATATKIEAADVGVETEIQGDLDVHGSFEPDIVIVADTNAYTLVDADSGQVHLMPDLTADATLTLPAEVDHLHYRIVYVGGAEDAQDWIIDTGDDTKYFVGGLVQHDVDDGGDDTVTYYSDGNSNSKLTVYTPGAGTVVEMWCDGTNWRVTGVVVSSSDTGVAFADQ